MIIEELNKIEGITIEKGYSSDTLFVITGTDETLKIAATTLENAGFSCDNEMFHSTGKPDVYGTILFSNSEYPGLAGYYVLEKDINTMSVGEVMSIFSVLLKELLTAKASA